MTPEEQKAHNDLCEDRAKLSDRLAAIEGCINSAQSDSRKLEVLKAWYQEWNAPLQQNIGEITNGNPDE